MSVHVTSRSSRRLLAARMHVATRYRLVHLGSMAVIVKRCLRGCMAEQKAKAYLPLESKAVPDGLAICICEVD
eukprot:356038-Chlamydomonas_euryale.AAC.2